MTEQEMELKKKKKRLFLLDDQQREIMEKTLEYFESIHFGMTEFQIKNFVVNRVEFPTPFSRWRQAKLELWTRYCGVMETHFSYREAQAKIELAKARIQKLNRKALDAKEEESRNIHMTKMKLLRIKISRHYFSLAATRKTVRDKLGEMQAFYEVVQENEPFVTGDEKEEDKKFWNEKMKRMPGIFKERYDIEPNEEQ